MPPTMLLTIAPMNITTNANNANEAANDAANDVAGNGMKDATNNAANNAVTDAMNVAGNDAAESVLLRVTPKPDFRLKICVWRMMICLNKRC